MWNVHQFIGHCLIPLYPCDIWLDKNKDLKLWILRAALQLPILENVVHPAGTVLPGKRGNYYTIVLYYRQHSADIEMKDYKIKTSFVGPDRPKARLTKLVWILWILISWFIKWNVQAFQQLIVICRRRNFVYCHWGCT